MTTANELNMTNVSAASVVIVRDLIGLAGCMSISYGAWLLAPALGFIVGGGFMLAAAVVLSRKSG